MLPVLAVLYWLHGQHSQYFGRRYCLYCTAGARSISGVSTPNVPSIRRVTYFKYCTRSIFGVYIKFTGSVCAGLVHELFPLLFSRERRGGHACIIVLIHSFSVLYQVHIHSTPLYFAVRGHPLPQQRRLPPWSTGCERCQEHACAAGCPETRAIGIVKRGRRVEVPAGCPRI